MCGRSCVCSGFRPDNSISQSSLEFVASKLNGRACLTRLLIVYYVIDFYSCDLTKCRVLQLSEIQGGAEEEIAKVICTVQGGVLMLHILTVDFWS